VRRRAPTPRRRSPASGGNQKSAHVAEHNNPKTDTNQDNPLGSQNDRLRRASLNVLGVKMALLSADKLEKEILSKRGFSWGSVGRLCEQINSRLQDELSLIKVLVLEPRSRIILIRRNLYSVMMLHKVSGRSRI
jgi:hypothetical protein